jgi:hypothetical protein
VFIRVRESIYVCIIYMYIHIYNLHIYIYTHTHTRSRSAGRLSEATQYKYIYCIYVYITYIKMEATQYKEEEFRISHLVNYIQIYISHTRRSGSAGRLSDSTRYIDIDI